MKKKDVTLSARDEEVDVKSTFFSVIRLHNFPEPSCEDMVRHELDYYISKAALGIDISEEDRQQECFLEPKKSGRNLDSQPDVIKSLCSCWYRFARVVLFWQIDRIESDFKLKNDSSSTLRSTDSNSNEMEKNESSNE